MKHAIAIASLAVAAGFATTAWADSPNLNGSYGFTGAAVCLVSPAGFDSANRPNDHLAQNGGASFTRSFSVEGIRSFNGDGTGNVSGSAISVIGRPTNLTTSPSVSSANFQFDFTYTVDGNGGWTATMVPGSFHEQITSGPRNGQTVTMLDGGIPPVIGMISQDGKTLTGAHITPQIETRVFSNGDVSQEMCHRSRVFISLQPNNQGNGNGH